MLMDLFQIKNHHQCESLNCSVHWRTTVTDTGCEKLLPETTSDVCAAVCATVVDTARQESVQRIQMSSSIKTREGLKCLS